MMLAGRSAAPARCQLLKTLAPVRGLAKWISGRRADADSQPRLESALAVLRDIKDTPWWEHDAQRGDVAKAVMPLAAHYYVTARDDRGGMHDPVSRFHLRNGARLDRINWEADLSEAGLRSSYGVMVNYAYRLDEIEKNHERFVTDGTVNVSSRVRKLAAAEFRPVAAERPRIGELQA